MLLRRVAKLHRLDELADATLTRILLIPHPIERGGHIVLHRGEQVRIAVGDVHRLVAYALGDGQRREAPFNQQAHVAVNYVMYADALYAQRLALALHVMGQEVLGHGEQALVGGNFVEHLDEVHHLVAQEFCVRMLARIGMSTHPLPHP